MDCGPQWAAMEGGVQAMLGITFGPLRREWMQVVLSARITLKSVAGMCVLLTASMPCLAQSTATGVDLRYDTLLERQDRNKTTPGNEFGDQHGLEGGSLSFNVVDVDLPGSNTLAVEFRRTLVATDPMKNLRNNTRAYPATRLGDWALGLPKIQGTFDALAGWITSDSSRPTKNCSVAGGSQMQPPPGLEYPDTFRAHMFWNPPTVHYPDGSSGLLVYNDNLMPTPSAGGPYFWITSSQDVASCISSLKNRNAASSIAEERIFGQGEGYLITRPDGTKYWFDWMALESKLPSISSAASGSVIAEVVLQQATLALYPTRVEDRFGNWVTYSYSNKSHELVKLDKIQSSDGRVIDIGYVNGHLSTVTANGRTWSYFYDNRSAPPSFPVVPLDPLSLTEVRNPDSSSWRYSGISHPNPPPAVQWPCHDLAWTQRVNPDATTVGDTDFAGYTVDAPSGARAVFRVGAVMLGRSAVPDGCYQAGAGTPGAARPYTVPRRFLGGYRYALTGKKVTGPGLSPAIWKYHYQSDIGFAPMANGTSRTKVLDPKGVLDTYTFGNTYGVDEGLLLTHARTFNQQTVLSKTDAYAAGTTTLVFPKLIGYHRDAIDRTPAMFLRPKLSAAVVQNGTTFRSAVNNLDAFARPTSVTKSSTLSGNPTKTEITTYHDNLSKWVLGQPSKLTVNGTVVSEIGYSSYAQPLTYKSYGKLQWTRTHDVTTAGQMGTIKTIKDGNGNITTFSNWKRGIPQTITYADGTAQKAVVNDSGWITRITDENGFATNYAYDPMGRLSKITYPTGDSTAWTATTISFAPQPNGAYGLPAGFWRQDIITGDYRKNVYFDALWRPVLVRERDNSQSSATSRFQRFTYDHEGRVTFASYPSTSSGPTTGTWTEYDALGRVRSVAQDSEHGLLVTLTSYLSNADGYYTRVTDPRGGQTRTWFQAFDQPNYDTPIAISRPGGTYTGITRDVFGKPTALTRRNSDGSISLTRSYTYNANQELCRAVEPETGATLMGYDGAGNLTWSAAGLAAGTACHATGLTTTIQPRRVARTYDARNRLKTLAFPDGKGNQTWTYTSDGLPASVEANNGDGNVATTSYTYNRRRLMTQERLVTPWYNWPITYAYNGNGHLASQKWHGLTVDYAPNALGQPTQAGTFARDVLYYPNGAIKQFTYGNGVVHTMTQNARRLPSAVVDCALAGTSCANSNKRMHLTYEYDAHGNVTKLRDYRGGWRDRDMTYDGLDRLTGATSSTFGTASYSYDVLDNLKVVQVTGGSQPRNHTYTYDANWRLTKVTPSSGSAINLSYDVQGNLKSKGGVQYSFDYDNRLRSASGGSATSSYVYDAFGRRIQDETAAGPTYSQYNQAGQLLQSSDQRRKVFSEFIYLGSRLIAIRERLNNVHTIKYQHADVQGTPVAVTGENKALLQSSDYEPYGLLVNRPLTDGPGYTGHVQDAATGLTYMQQRYYDPQLGVFLSVDPVTAYSDPIGQFHRYRYANNNPYKFTDPDGRLAFLVPVGAAAGRCAINAGCRAAVAGGARAAGRGARQATRWIGAVAMGGVVAAQQTWQANESAGSAESDPNGPTDKETRTRGAPGADGGESQITVETDSSGRTISTTHTVTTDGEVVHQHQDHHGENGSTRRFSDELTGTDTIGEGRQEPPVNDNGPRFPREPASGGRY